MDFIFYAISLLGGIAMFLYGMSIMGTGLEKLSGSKLEKILEKLTNNPLKGLLLGLGITAVIQSSSSTTVMLVGFVNSGIMKLSQVISVIMGSNIGTTVTTWLLAINAVDGDNLLMRLLKPDSFAPLLGVAGVILYSFLHGEKKKDIGSILIGFFLLMAGMSTMSDAVKPLQDVPAFTELFVKFSNPILGILVGASLTAIIQSSSASVGILQALSTTGLLTYKSVIPIILGQNIGTCVTALISSIGTSKNAKRVAIVHLYFNIIGTIIFCILYYSVSAIIGGFGFNDNTINEVGIAIIHTIFNIITTIILFPFIKGLEKLAYLTIKDSDDDVTDEVDEFAVLDERLLSTPSFAIEHCRSLVYDMASLTKDNLSLSVSLFDEYSKDNFHKVSATEDKIDIYEDKLYNYLVQLSYKDLSYKDNQSVNSLQHVIGNIERIADHAMNIAKTAKKAHKKELEFSNKALRELDVLNKAINDILNRTISSLMYKDVKMAESVEPLEEVIDDLCSAINKRHLKRLKKGKCSVDAGFVLNDILNNYERVSDHCSNIAISVIQANDTTIDAHEYTSSIKKNSDSAFKDKYYEFKKEYILPQSLAKTEIIEK